MEFIDKFKNESNFQNKSNPLGQDIDVLKKQLTEVKNINDKLEEQLKAMIEENDRLEEYLKNLEVEN
jgi:septal ring factor EnvC (AmiA/AmiB activator)